LCAAIWFIKPNKIEKEKNRMSKKIFTFLSMLAMISVLIAGCAGAAQPTPTSAPTQAQPTEAPANVVTPSQPAQPPAPPAQASATAVQPTETSAPPAEAQNLILATTTSTQDSGLLDYLLPDFEKEFNTKIDVIAVGTGQAIKLGEDGNADVLLVHARAQEDAFMAAGHGVRREDVMYNDFVLVGPEQDPAGIAGREDATAAFKQIADKQTPFVSRGDNSGTNTKELAIWKAAGIEPAGDWYISAGQGMGAVLTMASEQQAYTLSDRATYLARTLEGLDLKILVEGDPILFNPYGVIAVNPAKNPDIHADLANTFIDWLVSLPVQEKISKFGVDQFGAPLFTPDATSWREAHGGSAQSSGGAEENVALKITGMVDQEMGWAEADIRAMDTVDVQSENNQGQSSTYTGVLITNLLDLAGVKAGAVSLVFVGDDGYTAEAPLADVQACSDCIVSFRSKGGFSAVLPGFANSLQVKGLVEIQVK
jgi:tungstate transport system substrate-binding protein